MTIYNESPDNLVEVNINLDCFCYIPQVGKDGTIAFAKVLPSGDISMDLVKLKVPSEALVSQEALSDYFSQKQEGYEFVSFDDINVWDADSSNARGGKFRF